MFSPDGNHFWDGQKWQSALSPDGRWRWDGRQWTPLEARPEALRATVQIAAAAAPGAAAPQPHSWQVVTPQSRSLAAQAGPAPATQAGTLPGLDGPRRKTNRVVGYRREPTLWTNKLVLMATCYFVGGGIYGIVLTAALAPIYHDRFFYGVRTASQMTSRQADDLATFATSIFVGVSVFFSAIAILLGLASFRRISLVFNLQLIGTLFCIFSFIGDVTTSADQRDLIPPNIFWSSVIINLAGGVLFFVLLFARRAHGAWGLKKVPVYADAVD